MNNTEIIIIGGGLSGLATAYYLEKYGMHSTIIEARKRLGGRIYTLHKKGVPPMEMGATWLGKKHTYLLALLKELGIETFEQFMGEKAFYEPISTSPPQLVHLPYNPEPSYRIAGGTGTLISSLASILKKSRLVPGQPVKSIEYKRKMTVRTDNDCYVADFVISTLPPKLLSDSISFTPALPAELNSIASLTHSWMAESIKIGLSYSNAFWRTRKTSGTIMSNAGPVTEMYDHSAENQQLYALTGFMNSIYHSISAEKRKNMVIEHLIKFYGSAVTRYISYHELVWRDDPFTYSSYERDIVPHQNNGNPLFTSAFFDGHFLLAGAETATLFPGYMDGAVESAVRVAKKVKKVTES